MAGKPAKYAISADVILRTLAAADDSLAAILARSRFGIAIAAINRMIATTISSSINENPFCFRISAFQSVAIAKNRTSHYFLMHAQGRSLGIFGRWDDPVSHCYHRSSLLLKNDEATPHPCPPAALTE